MVRLARTGSTLNLVRSILVSQLEQCGKVEPSLLHTCPVYYSIATKTNSISRPFAISFYALHPVFLKHSEAIYSWANLLALPALSKPFRYNRHPGSITRHAEYTTSSAITPTRRYI